MVKEKFMNARIETDRLILRPLIEEDVMSIFIMATEASHFKYQPDLPPATLSEIESLVEWSKSCNLNNTPIILLKKYISLIWLLW